VAVKEAVVALVVLSPDEGGGTSVPVAMPGGCAGTPTAGSSSAVLIMVIDSSSTLSFDLKDFDSGLG